MYNEAIKIKADEIDAIYGLASKMIVSSKYSEAKTLLIKSLEPNPKNLEAEYKLGLVYESQGKLEQV